MNQTRTLCSTALAAFVCTFGFACIPLDEIDTAEDPGEIDESEQELTGTCAYTPVYINDGSRADVTMKASWQCWTPWLNRDDPSGIGDYETLADFVAAGKACSNPTGIECQTKGGTDWTQTGEVYTCNTTIGGYCVNQDQRDGGCQNYRVRFLCP
jgi:hypothetical protein